MIQKRKICVICENKLIEFANIEYPIYDCCSIDIENKLWNMKYAYCEKCHSIQLITLLDPNILYSGSYFQPVNNKYWWIQHNISFVNFIISNLDINNSIIEIGGSSFCLGKHLVEYYKEYTVFDYSLDSTTFQKDIKYIQGNCETYSFESSSNLILSHVFEHLYNPGLFIENCKNNKVSNIIIAIPDMNNTNELHVCNQHTFLYNACDIEYIFSKYGYFNNKKIFFESNDKSFKAIFFHFKLIDTKIIIKRIINPGRKDYSIKLLTQKIEIPKNCFIATAGIWGNLLYSLISNKENVIGVIDYDINKQNKKFNITNLIIQDYNYLKNYNHEYSILLFGPRINNIIKSIDDVNKEINIICY